MLRVEDIDPHRTGAADQQLRDLERIGITWDEEPLYQSTRFDVYNQVLAELTERAHVFECFCSRKDIRQAANAPHTLPGHYPGTCLHLTEKERHDMRQTLTKSGRIPALRLHPRVQAWQVFDEMFGTYTGPVDAFVLRRSDAGPAYNLAAVVDDALSGVDQVVRGDDLLSSSPGQGYLTSLLGAPTPVYGHVPLVLNTAGQRLAKRDGAVTLTELMDLGWEVGDVMAQLSESLGTQPLRSAQEFLTQFDPTRIPHVSFHFAVDTGLCPS